MKHLLSILLFFYSINGHAQSLKRILKEAKFSYSVADYDKALSKSNILLENDSLNYEALLIRGSSYYYLGEKDSGYTDLIKYSKHKRLDSSYFKIWISLKNYYEDKHKYFEALICSRKASISKPEEKDLTQYDSYSITSNKRLAYTIRGESSNAYQYSH